MHTKIFLKCRSCGFEIDARSSDDPIPEFCPSCGSRKMEFSVALLPSGRKEEVIEDSHVPLKPLIDDSFLRQVAPGEYLIDLSLASREVALAELEPGVYEILIGKPSFVKKLLKKS
ncbi:MAG: hypothetical protein RMI85_06850 [Candidatus Korarchaeum sp.]|nr:hypothetical protein [Candidatus Korarchaeum sp.]